MSIDCYGVTIAAYIFNVITCGVVNLVTSIMLDKHHNQLAEQIIGKNQDIQRAMETAFGYAVQDIFKKWGETVGSSEKKSGDICCKFLSDHAREILFGKDEDALNDQKIREMLFPKNPAPITAQAISEARNRANENFRELIKPFIAEDLPESFRELLQTQLLDKTVFYFKELFKGDERVFAAIVLEDMNALRNQMASLQEMLIIKNQGKAEEDLSRIILQSIVQFSELWLVSDEKLDTLIAELGNLSKVVLTMLEIITQFTEMSDKKLNTLIAELKKLSDRINILIEQPDPEPPEPAYPCMSDDTDCLPPTCKLPKRSGMPYRSVPYFTGRITELWEIHFLLKRKQTAVIEGKSGQGTVGLVTGMGGLGKTQLAVEYVHRFGVCYPGGVFWVNAEQGIPEMILRLCQDAKIEVDTRLEEKRQMLDLWSKMGSLGQVLIVMDNFRENEALQPRLPPGGAIYVLVTTRRRDLTGYSRICLEILSAEDGAALLSSGERKFGEAAEPLAEALGGLPLALELARNFLNISNMSIEELLEEIRILGEMEALNLFAEEYKNEMPSGHVKEVSATIQMSYRLVSDFAKKVMQVMAMLAPTPIPRRLLREILQVSSQSRLKDPLDKAIRELSGLSLVNLDEESDPFMHRLIAGFVKTITPPFEKDAITPPFSKGGPGGISPADTQNPPCPHTC